MNEMNFSKSKKIGMFISMAGFTITLFILFHYLISSSIEIDWLQIFFLIVYSMVSILNLIYIKNFSYSQDYQQNKVNIYKVMFYGALIIYVISTLLLIYGIKQDQSLIMHACLGGISVITIFDSLDGKIKKKKISLE